MPTYHNTNVPINWHATYAKNATSNNQADKPQGAPAALQKGLLLQAIRAAAAAAAQAADGVGWGGGGDKGHFRA